MAITASEARARLFPLIEEVNVNEKPVTITSKGGNAVLISESEYESIIETAYLLSSPANREHLLKSMGQADRGETIEIEFPADAESLPQALRDAMKKKRKVKKRA
jgi:antitoxin YefM